MRRMLVGLGLAALLFSATPAGAARPLKCRKVVSGSTYDISFQSRSFKNGATGTGVLWQVDRKDGGFYISGKLQGGSAKGRIGTWVRVTTPEDKFVASNAEARTYSIHGQAVPPSQIDEQNNSKAAKLSRTCARRGHA